MPRPLHDAAFEREWATLRRKLRLAQGFCFIVYFVDDERLALEIKSRLRDTLTFSTSHLIEISVDEPSELASKSLAAVFEAADLEVHRDVCAPFWLEAFRGRGDPAWDKARVELLMRLNERRSRLEAEVRCPLILLLPAGSQREAASRAPDMWHVRVHSAVLGRGAAVAGEAAGEPTVAPERPGDRPPAPAAETPGPRSPPREVAYWRRQRKADDAKSWFKRLLNRWRGVPAPDDLSPWDGFAAVDALLAQGAWKEAGDVARDVLQLARSRASRRHGDDRSDALHGLSVALNKVGDAEAAAGRGEAALAAYRESLVLRRELRSALGDAPRVLRDLSISLDGVGNAEAAAGRDEAALAAYRESLALCRELRSALGEAPQVLRDLSVALNNVGDAEAATGQGEAALAAYRESLALRRELRSALGDAPRVLRDLFMSLIKVGNAEAVVGQGEAALAAYRESLVLARRLRAALSDTLQVLDDLAFSLECVAATEAAPVADRRTAAQEAVTLRQRLAAALPDRPTHRDRLAAAEHLAASLENGA